MDRLRLFGWKILTKRNIDSKVHAYIGPKGDLYITFDNENQKVPQTYKLTAQSANRLSSLIRGE